MNYGTSGRELLLELHRGDRGSDGTFLPSYNAKLVRACLDDLNHSVQALQEEVQAVDDTSKMSMQVRPSILLHNAAIQRHKRCLLAYHHTRMDKLKRQILLGECPTSTSSTSGSSTSTHVGEREFVQDYQQLRSHYAAAVFDLGLLPPTSHMVQVRVLQNQGEIVLESGRSLLLSKGSLHFLPRSDVQDFLQAGTCELLDGEEMDCF
jgi:GINS complex subunit 1